MTKAGGLILLLVLAAVSIGSACAEPVVVSAGGSGPSREDAILQALSQAVQQVNGVLIETTTEASLELKRLVRETDRQTMFSEKFRNEISLQSGGVVRTYDILSVDQESPGHFTASLKVTVEHFKAPGLPPENRRRIIVVTFSDVTNDDAKSFVLAIADQLTAYLTQTRRFSVLDRQNLDAYKNELDLIRSNDTAFEEKVKLGRALGTNYLVICRLKDFGTGVTEKRIEVTGEFIKYATVATAIQYQVVEVGTRQVKWADKTAYHNTVTGNLEFLRSTAADALATTIGSEISSTIYPLRIINADEPGELVINQGGITVSVGQTYKAMLLGNEMHDPYTLEPLGGREKEVALVEITRVEPKVSYGRVISGNIPPNVDLVLRPVPLGAKRGESGPLPPKQTPFD